MFSLNKLSKHFFERSIVMKKHFWRITSVAVVTAFALMTGVAVAANNDEQAVVSAAAATDLTGEKAVAIAISNDYAQTYQNTYDEVLAREAAKVNDDAFYGPGDPYVNARKTAEEEAQAKCEELGLYTRVELTRTDATSYIGWTGTFEIDSIEDTELYFSTPNNFLCWGGKRKATMKGDYAHAGNLKIASVALVYSNGETSRNLVRGTSQTVSATADAKSGIIETGHYTLRMCDGTGNGAKLMEQAYIELIRK